MDKMYGVTDGVYICNQGRVDELNNRISERNIPSNGLQPQYSIRPTSTKYAYMPILDQYKKATVPLETYTPFSTSAIFNPGNAQAPWSGFSNNINVESQLRNQFLPYKNASNLYMFLHLRATCIKQRLIILLNRKHTHCCLRSRI